MHKKLLNEATFQLTISVEGPFLIKSGTETWDPTVPDMQFVRTRHARLGDTVFIPGSSLKGTLRSYSEKIARTLDVACCNPFATRKDDKAALDLFCGKKLEDDKLTSAEIYGRSCAACRIYGSTAMAGRASFGDCYPMESLSPRLTKRTGVAIDRILGSAAGGALFDVEALMGGDFAAVIGLRNFELWQLGLIGLAIRDLCLGRVRIGFGKSRGFGSVSARLAKLEIRSLRDEGLRKDEGKLSIRGIGSLLGDERASYGIKDTEVNPVEIVTDSDLIDELIGSSIVFSNSDSQRWCAPEAESIFAESVRSHWKNYAASHQANGRQNG